jgi:hypothetical protein
MASVSRPSYRVWQENVVSQHWAIYQAARQGWQQKRRNPMADTDEVAVVGRDDRTRRRGSGVLRYIPGFVYILAVFIIGQFIFPDPRTTFFTFGGYELAWVEVLLAAAAIMAMAEQVKVAEPGVNNTLEVLFVDFH